MSKYSFKTGAISPKNQFYEEHIQTDTLNGTEKNYLER